MRRSKRNGPAVFLVCAMAAATAVAADGEGPSERDGVDCPERAAEARARAASLPAGDISRRFAERDLDTAEIEAAQGETEDCEELVERALRVLTTRPYRLRPGEKLGTTDFDLPD